MRLIVFSVFKAKVTINDSSWTLCLYFSAESNNIFPQQCSSRMAFFSLSHTNGEHSYPEKQGTRSCSYPYHEWLCKLSGGSAIRLFRIGVLCGLVRSLQATWDQTPGAPRALNWVNSQDRRTRESEQRAHPKLSNPTPHYRVQSDHIFHLANTPRPPASIIQVFGHSPLICF